MIRRDVEREAIGSRRERSILGERHEPAVLVGRAARDGRPFALLAQLEDDGDAGAGGAESQVQDMRCNHVSNFASRKFVIFRCSSAATASSLHSSLVNRCSSSESISSADLPVAQTMKM